MKKILILLLVATSFVFFACKKDNDTVSQTDNPPTTLNPFAERANWVVIDFMINGTDQTINFSGSTMIFNPVNTFSISNDIMSADGRWSFENQADNSVHLHLDFNSEAVNNEWWMHIDDMWKVKRLEANNLMLESTTGTKTMTLQKLAR